MSNGLSRKNQILVGVLVLQLLLAVVLLWPRGAQTSSNEPMFADLDQVIEVRIQDNTDSAVTLVKSGELWVLPDADDYPTQENKVQDLLDKLAAFESNRLVTQTASSHRRLQVAADEFVRQVTLTWADGTAGTFFLGTAPSYGVIHVRFDRQDEVYLVSNLSVADVGASAGSWIDTLYLSIDTAQVFDLTLENANGAFTFSKGEGDVWLMTGLGAEEVLSQADVTSLVSRAASVRMIKPLGKQGQAGYGTQTPGALVTVKARDAEGNETTTILRVGTKDEETGNYVVISSASPYYVQVSGYSVQDFVEKTREDFIEPPPTPAAE
ncbi:MAG: DUF4340 domain-containing protein [Anaerolineae bacterium]|nr:DUF4340 domain-containing protein [Anaerolineae bacterium]